MSGDHERFSAELLEEQIAYYRARAPVYDDWWEAQGTDPRSDELRGAWLAERSLLEADLHEWCAGVGGASMLELAACTGNITRLAARHAARVTAVDASPEVLAINAPRSQPTRRRSSTLLEHTDTATRLPVTTSAGPGAKRETPPGITAVADKGA